MPKQYCKKIILFFIISLFFVTPFSRVSASDTTSTEQIKKAIELRNKALETQNKGNYFEAMKVLSEAISLYPQYAQAYCDMGILYEAFGIKKDAEIIYLKALEIDPGCLNAYTNLALLYESMQDFSKAAYYWKKRAELGSPNDKWTQKAKEKLLALSQDSPAFNIEERVNKEIADSGKMMKNEAKEKKEINALRDDVVSRDKELSLKKQEFELLKQEISALKDKKDRELLAKNQELDLVSQQMKSFKSENDNKLVVTKQQIDQLNQRINLLQQENENKLSAKDEQIELLKQKVLYVQQQSKEEIAGKQQEVAKAAEQLTELIGSLREDFTTFKSKDLQQITAK